MAFCPHCGKSVTDQASKCLACGKEFEPRAKAARLVGTTERIFNYRVRKYGIDCQRFK